MATGAAIAPVLVAIIPDQIRIEMAHDPLIGHNHPLRHSLPRAVGIENVEALEYHWYPSRPLNSHKRQM